MLIAGEASGDLLAAELVAALREKSPDAQFFGAGGAKMSAAGVELAFDMTQHSVIGVSDVLEKYFEIPAAVQPVAFALAIERKPDVVIGVDYGGFTLRFGQAVKKYVRENPFSKWDPKIVQFVSPQVWASRPGRADKLARDYDLLLSIFPFEKDWYAKRVPKLRVEFVGHPMIGRFAKPNTLECGDTSPLLSARHVAQFQSADTSVHSKILLLPGSRKSELQRHLPWVMLAALKNDSGKTAVGEGKNGIAKSGACAACKITRRESGNPNRRTAVGIGRGGHRHRLDGHGDDGMRLFWRADGDALQKPRGSITRSPGASSP